MDKKKPYRHKGYRVFQYRTRQVSDPVPIQLFLLIERALTSYHIRSWILNSCGGLRPYPLCDLVDSRLVSACQLPHRISCCSRVYHYYYILHVYIDTIWCDWPESNRHAVKREILSLLCLPISPQSRYSGGPPVSRTRHQRIMSPLL